MEHLIPKEELRRKFKTDFERGIKQGEAEARLEVYGKNILKQEKKENLIVKFIKQFNDFMILILIAAAAISAVMAKLEGTGDYVESIIIIAIVVFNALMGVIQENKAEKSLEALRKMAAPTSKVIRDGQQITVKGEDIVPGDIVILEARKLRPSRLSIDWEL